jgi:hypothetical protein
VWTVIVSGERPPSEGVPKRVKVVEGVLLVGGKKARPEGSDPSTVQK